MPFINRLGGQVVDLQSKTITASSDSQIITPDSGYDGFSQVTVPAYPEYLQKLITVTAQSGGSSSSTNPNTTLTIDTSAFANIPASIVRHEPYTDPDFIIINPRISSGTTLYIPADTSNYNYRGVISIIAQLIDPENGTYASYVTAYTGYSYYSGSELASMSTPRIYTGYTTNYHYDLDLQGNTLLVFLKASASTNLTERPWFNKKVGASSSDIKQCYFSDINFMYTNANNTTFAPVSYSAMFFWNVNSSIYTSVNQTT